VFAPYVAVTWVASIRDTRDVVTVTDLKLVPGRIVTEGGMAAIVGFDVVIVTTAPPGGACALSVIVIVVDDGPLTREGWKLRSMSTAAVTVSVSVTETLPTVAVTIAVVSTTTPIVLIANVTEVWPCGTTTEGGGMTAGLSLESPTTTPPAGACPERVTVPFADVPPTTDEGVMLKLTGTAAKMSSVADAVDNMNVPVIVAVMSAVTVVVSIVKVASVSPSLTVTVDGTVAAGLSELNEIVIPPGGAASSSVTVPVEESPPGTLEGSMPIVNPT
jgi:hypothetical protein